MIFSGETLNPKSEGSRPLVARQAGSQKQVRVNVQHSFHNGGAAPSLNTWMEGTSGS